MSIRITKEQLVKIGALPVNAEKYVKPLNDTCNKYNINTIARVCAFICQTFEETGALSITTESLNYSAERMMEVWPKRFPSLESAQPYAHNPQALAEKTYGGRGGNPVGKAYLYCGRGALQLTFFNNYRACGLDLGVDFVNHPELVAEPEYFYETAGWFWNKTNCNKYADGDSEYAVREVTGIVNGNPDGNLKTRVAYWHKAKAVIDNSIFVNDAPVVSSVVEAPKVEVKPVEQVKEEPKTVAPVTSPVVTQTQAQKPSLLTLIVNALSSIFKKKGN